jgi:uncharacterized small protein (DUF1192 family)
MNEAYAPAAMSSDAVIGGQRMLSHRNTTVAENIDNRVKSLQEQIERLQAVKQKLATGSILDVSLEDLQMAMGRY